MLQHKTLSELEASLGELRQAPRERGELRLIVARPRPGQRQVLERGELSLSDGLVGDGWLTRARARGGRLETELEMQLTLMNVRVIALLSPDASRWPLAGDQLFVDLDLGVENLPPGTELEIGSALVRVTPPPHTGCKKFVRRFGLDAMKFVNSPIGRQLNLRGINARVVTPGAISVGDAVVKRGRGK